MLKIIRRGNKRKKSGSGRQAFILHGEFVRQTAKVMGEDTWRWLRNGFLKKETEGLILAAQEQALRTNAIKYNIDKTSETSLCRMCGDTTETVGHIANGARNLPRMSTESAMIR